MGVLTHFAHLTLSYCAEHQTQSWGYRAKINKGSVKTTNNKQDYKQQG